MYTRFPEVDPRASLPSLEEETLKFWQEENIFHESLNIREEAPEFVVYDGPPTANGNPGIHHVQARAYKDLFPFKAIIPISAKTGEGVTELIDELFDALPYGEMFFPDDEITDQPIRQIVAEMIREKALKLLSEEIPHGIAVVIENFRDNENDGITDIDALIYCEKESHKGIIIGKGGSMIKKIGHDARLDIENLLENKVFLTLNVKVKKNWRQSDILIKNFGYKKEDEA